MSELGGLLQDDSQSMDLIKANDREGRSLCGCFQQRKEQHGVHYRNTIAT